MGNGKGESGARGYVYMLYYLTVLIVIRLLMKHTSVLRFLAIPIVHALCAVITFVL